MQDKGSFKAETLQAMLKTADRNLERVADAAFKDYEKYYGNTNAAGVIKESLGGYSKSVLRVREDLGKLSSALGHLETADNKGHYLSLNDRLAHLSTDLSGQDRAAIADTSSILNNLTAGFGIAMSLRAADLSYPMAELKKDIQIMEELDWYTKHPAYKEIVNTSKASLDKAVVPATRETQHAAVTFAEKVERMRKGTLKGEEKAKLQGVRSLAEADDFMGKNFVGDVALHPTRYLDYINKTANGDRSRVVSVTR